MESLAPFYNSFLPSLLSSLTGHSRSRGDQFFTYFYYWSLLLWLLMFVNLAFSLMSFFKAALLISKVYQSAFHRRELNAVLSSEWTNEWITKWYKWYPHSAFVQKKLRVQICKKSYLSILLGWMRVTLILHSKSFLSKEGRQIHLNLICKAALSLSSIKQPK